MLHFRRLPSWKILLLLIIFSGLTEGIGMSALIPILGTISTENNSLNSAFPFNIIPDTFRYIGIEPNFLILLGACVFLIIMTFSLTYMQDRILYKSKYKFLVSIREEALRKLFESSWFYLSKKKSGELSNILIHETERGAESLTALLTMFAIGIQLLFYIAFTFVLSWEMTLMSLVTISISGIVAMKLINQVRQYGEMSVKADTDYNRYIIETITASKLLKATATSDSFLKIVNKTGYQVSKIKNKIVTSQATLRFALQVMIILAMALILFLGIEYFMVSVNILFVFMFILMRLAPKTFTFYAQFHNYSAFKPALNIVDKLLTEVETSVESFNKISKNKLDFNEEILFENVHFSHELKDQFSLKNLNVSLPSNKIIGVAGKSGGGKTTFIDLALGLFKPDEGIIKVDGINLNLINKNEYRNIISYVPQDNIFFNGTIRENITLGIDNVEDKEVIKCLKVAQIYDFVFSFSTGLYTLMSEAGSNMSGGQKQRLAIARALLRKPKLLILDEATSSLDNEIESNFRNALEQYEGKVTIIIVAHRLSNLRNTDFILVFDKGEIVQNGKYNQLSIKDGIFKKLLEINDRTIQDNKKFRKNI